MTASGSEKTLESGRAPKVVREQLNERLIEERFFAFIAFPLIRLLR